LSRAATVGYDDSLGSFLKEIAKTVLRNSQQVLRRLAMEKVQLLPIAATALSAAFGAALGVAGGIYRDIWTKNHSLKRDRKLFSESLKKLIIDLDTFEFSRSDYLLTGIAKSGVWHIERIRLLINQIDGYLTDAKSVIVFEDFKDINAFWTVKKSINDALYYLEIQESGLKSDLQEDGDNFWDIFVETIEAIIRGVAEGLNQAIMQLQFGDKHPPARIVEPSQFFRIIRIPNGEAPRWVRSAWVGLVLPRTSAQAASDITGIFTKQVEDGSRYQSEYRTTFLTAITVLNEFNPAAAQWWQNEIAAKALNNEFLLFDDLSCVPA
jgi:hypothetical protein